MSALIPVFLFEGFLEGGKTSLINDFFKLESFSKQSVLLILTEEGDKEIALSSYADITNIRTLDSKDDLSLELLEGWQRECSAKQIIIEYNGMWELELLSKHLPGSWFVQQVVCCIDASTFDLYNSNMRFLMADKLRYATTVIFNRVNELADTDTLRRSVRALNRKADIMYEYENGEMKEDTSPDILPYDINKDRIEVRDEAFAVWQLDLNTFPAKYDKKNILFKGQIINTGDKILIGRRVMTCCEADIELCSFELKAKESACLKTGVWVEADVIVNAKNSNIVLEADELKICPAPVPEVAMF